jgi:hypothetical protein
MVPGTRFQYSRNRIQHFQISSDPDPGSGPASDPRCFRIFITFSVFVFVFYNLKLSKICYSSPHEIIQKCVEEQFVQIFSVVPGTYLLLYGTVQNKNCFVVFVINTLFFLTAM